MRVFFLTTELPWPPSGGGRVRSLAQLRLIAERNDVDELVVLTLDEGDVKPDDLRALRQELTCEVVSVPHPIHVKKNLSFVPRLAWLCLRGAPYLAAKWDGRGLRKAIVRELATRPFDVVYIDHLGMAQYLPEIRRAQPNARVVLEEHNVESDFFSQLADRLRGAKRHIVRHEWRRARAFEISALRGVDAVVAISENDARAFRDIAGVRAHVIPPVVRFERRAWSPVTPAREIGYVGSLSWQPNAAGLDWMCKDVWPRVRERLPDLTTTIVGSGLSKGPDGDPVVPHAWRVPGVSTVGFVKDLDPLEARWSAMVAPVFGGSGVRIKLLESFRAGVPVVTTPDGAAGLDVEDGRELLIAATPERFAARLVELVNDPALQVRLRDAGYAYLERHHAPSSADEAMRAALGGERGVTS